MLTKLLDLTFIRDGNVSQVEEMINFERIVIENICLYTQNRQNLFQEMVLKTIKLFEKIRDNV